jgi:hypothetical protein
VAGEWCPIDCNLATKPEVLELVDETGDPADAVIGRLVQLWLWSAMNSEDGTARMTVRRLGKLFGGSDTFWAGVQRVGWLQVDEASGTVAIPGWERRFGSAAKARAQAAVRHAREKEGRRLSAQGGGAGASDPGRASALELGELGDQKFSSSPREAWPGIRAAWNGIATLKPWKPDRPPKQHAEQLDDPGWCTDALAAIERLPRCRFFKTPPTMLQLFSPGFVDKVLAGTFDEPPGRQGGRDFGDGPAPPKVFTGEVAEAFERTRRKLAAAKEGT